MPRRASVCGFFFVVVSSQTPKASSSRAGDLCSLSHNWTAGVESFQERSNAISLLDIENSLGYGCQHVNGLALQLSASQVVFVPAGGCRLPTTLGLSPLPDRSPELSPQVTANIRQCPHWDCLGHLPWEPATSPLPSPSTDREMGRAQAAQQWPGTPSTP